MGVARYIKNEKDEILDVILQSGIHIKPLYTQEDLEEVGFDPAKDLGFPGEYPFTRGIHPLGYRSREWTTRLYSGFGTPEESNERFKLLIAHGQTGLNVAFDLPTQMGLDSDDPLAEDEVGRVGMAVDSLRDFEVAFHGIPLDRVGVSLTINAVATIILAMFEVMAEKFGFSKDRISATPQNDILKEIVARGAWIFPVKPAVRLIGDTIEYCMKELPRSSPVSVCGYHLREAGCNSVQDIAYTFQNANAYIEEVLSRGYSIDDFVGGFTFNFNVFGNLWEQVAKFRAARKLWAENLRERYGAKDKRSLLLRGMFGGGGGGLTKAQPENNIIRGAYYALAAGLSGAQTSGLCSFDEAYTIPTPRAALLSLRTLQILTEEIGLRDTIDPLAGSYFIETLTKQMEEKIKEEMKRIDEMGGMIKAIETGHIQREIAKQAYEFEKGIQNGELIKVGENKYVEGEEMDVELHEYRKECAEEQIKRLHEVKGERDNRKVVQLLKDLEKAARTEQNVMPCLVECCRAYATVGEMTKVFKEIYGEYKETFIL